MQLTQAAFAARLDRLGPFAPNPIIAAAVSGGADSMALAVLADRWCRARGGALQALIVDHGLRAGSAEEARLTAERLQGAGIAATVLRVPGLARGPGLAARARAARYAVLAAACRARGIADLLLGHHAADQAETLMIRALGGSGDAGLAGMAAMRPLRDLRLLRPLLDVKPDALRALLRAEGIGWVEDPSNADPAVLRARVRDAAGAAVAELAAAAAAAGAARAGAERRAAAWLAANATLRPEGFALIPPGPVPPAALSALIQTVGGACYPPPAESVAALAASPRAATLAGVRMLAAGRLGPGWLVVREAGAMAGPVPAREGAVWDGRFRLRAAGGLPPGAELGALADEAGRSDLPAAIRRTLPAIRDRGVLVCIPTATQILFDPPRPAACAAFVGMGGDGEA